MTKPPVTRNTCYVPVLRSRKAEHDALREVRPDVRQLIAPVIEITPAFASTMAGIPPKRIAQKVWQFAIGCGGTGDVYIDLADLLQHPESGVICTELEFLLLSIHARTQLVFHVADFNRRSVQEAKTLLARNGAAFRITRDEYASPSLNELIRFMRMCGLRYDEVDLLVDCQLVGEGQQLQGTVDKLENDFPWRSITYIGGSFPRDLSEFPRNGEYEVPRFEWLAYAQGPRPKRLARFGDYTIQHPLQRDPVPFPPSASLRYTTEDHWLVMRGEKPGGPNRPGREQYVGHAQLLKDKPEFRGPDFSAGDAYVELVASETTGLCGNATKWIQAGVNHHVTLAARQVVILRAA